MASFSEIKADGQDFYLSLVKLMEKPIKDIHGYLSGEFGDPVFKMSKVEFADGTFLGCEGEHDMPYLVTYGRDSQPNYSDKNLTRLMKEDPDYEDDEEQHLV